MKIAILVFLLSAGTLIALYTQSDPFIKAIGSGYGGLIFFFILFLVIGVALTSFITIITLFFKKPIGFNKILGTICLLFVLFFIGLLTYIISQYHT